MKKRHPYNQWSPDARALDLVGDKWTLLIVRDLLSGPRRFVNLQRTLPGISTEQLRSRLNQLVEDRILTRTRYREVPPRVDYELTARGRALAPVLGALCAWGHEWDWTGPRVGEAVDVTALFRLVPGLADPLALSATEAPRAIALTVLGHSDDGADAVYTVETDRSGVFVSERAPDGEPHAAIAGDQTAWVAALGPDGDRSQLDVAGSASLASALLDAIEQPRPVAAALARAA